MNRRILFQVTIPTIVIGLILLCTCVGSMWSINRLQSNTASILSDSVTSLEAAGDMEIKLRQLRFHSYLYVMDPTPVRWKLIEEDHRGFETALHAAQLSADPQEQLLLEEITTRYSTYRKKLEEDGTFPKQLREREDFLRWADAHPVQPLVQPCRELLQVNRESMKQTAKESADVSAKTHTVMIILGIVGPLAGLLVGYGIARGLSHSIARFHIRLQDAQTQLDPDAETLDLETHLGATELESQMERLVARIRQVVSALHQQHQDLIRAEQLSAVGQLAASIAHEIRNPLMPIKVLIGTGLSGRTLTLEDLRIIHGEIGRVERTVQSLLEFARPPALRRVSVDLRMILAQSIDLVRTRATQQEVQIAVNGGKEPLDFNLDADQMKTVFVNLLLNALDAMRNGGRISIVARADSAGAIHIQVLDSGPGIPASIVPHLFEPFVTSKETGTGLGLSVCRRVIREHGGEITAINRPEGGTCFTITLRPQTAQE